MPDFEDLELLVAKIQMELAPTAQVLHNQRLPGRKSGRQRQIDVLVKDKIGQYDIQIVIDCKDYKKPADVKSVEEFFGLLDDVGAQKGVLVCPSGFSQTAKTRAEGLQIDLYSPVDTDTHKWTASPTIPVVCDFRGAAISFGISVSGPYPFQMPYDFQNVNQVVSASGEETGTMLGIAMQLWNDGELPTEPGEHEKLLVFGDNPHMDNGLGMNIPVDLWIGLTVQQSIFYGMMPITKISGFKDEIGGGVITNAFETGVLDADKVWEEWKQISRIEECDLPPVMHLQGLIGWDIDHPERRSIPAEE